MYNHAEMALDELVRRALSAYFKDDGDELPTSATVKQSGGKRYVVLRKGGQLLGCFRVRNDGKLKRLVRPPEGI